MNQLVVRALDIFIPQKIKALKKVEELNRARTLVFLILAHIIAACALTVFFHSSQYKITSVLSADILVSICFFGQLLSLIIFRVTARHVLAGNVFALTYYISAFLTAFSFDGQALCGFLLYFLALPLLVTFLTNYTSGIFWLIAVVFCPILLNFFEDKKIEQLFIENWIASSLGLFVVIHVIYKYIEHLSARLNYQCALFEVAATHDSLTKLANRAAFEERLRQSIEFCKSQGSKTVLVYIDLDKFKPINDTYGHHAGDLVLTTIASRLRSLVRDTDMVARLGGDEFAIIFDRCDPEKLKPIINRISIVVRESIEVSGKYLNVGCSMGVVTCPDDGFDADRLACEADSRMYTAKRQAVLS